MDLKTRLGKHLIMRDHYEGRFDLFLEDYFDWLGFGVTDVQADIGRYIGHPTMTAMCVMAQRGEAKSTIAIAKALHSLVVAPTTRVLIVSAGEGFADTISYAIVKSILTWERLDFLRPDKAAGDRTSTSEGFDVHFALRGVDKQPSIKSVGITGQLAGNRADLLIADDVETAQNSRTSGARAILIEATKEFSAICTHGVILYLGTPQSRDSIYSTLPGRGFDVRIWPGRYPSHEEEERYAGKLAPFILAKMLKDPSLRTGYGLCGTKGASTDTGRYSEEDLIKKFLDYQEHGFQLQFMLDTTLADALRQQLKIADLIIWDGGTESAPDKLHWSNMPKFRIDLPADYPIQPAPVFYAAADHSNDWVNFDRKLAYLDPAGGGSDETAIYVTASIGPFIHVIGLHAYVGGQTEENIKGGVEFLSELGVTSLEVEDNMGHGTVVELYKAELRRQKVELEIFGSYSKGQKELRILDRLFAVTKRHRLVVHRSVLDADTALTRARANSSYSTFAQLERITPERGSLEHDDRLEALAGAVQRHVQALAQDEDSASEARSAAEYQKFMQDPMGTANLVRITKPPRRRGRTR